MAAVEIRNGVVYVEGKPLYLASAEYPYFRDKVENWNDRLDRLKSCGVKVITCYLPWRHHEILIGSERRFDFRGSTLDNRNAVGFLQLCHEKGLLVIAKPGPFIHAETNYGGLPDFVCPANNPEIEAMLDHAGRAVTWPGSEPAEDGRTARPWPLPAPLSATFLREVERWLGRVHADVIARFAYPEGPVILIQLANEGVYSNAQRPPWEYDYSGSSVEFFRRCLKDDYRTLSRYNALHGTAHTAWQQIEPPREWKQPVAVRDLVPYMDWSAYQWKYMREIYRVYRSFLATDLPCLVNINPALDDPSGVDAWLSRVNPDEWPDVHYGFTNWIGVATDAPSVLERYLLLAKRSRGPNLEENWGFTEPYGHNYRFGTVCYAQTLVAIAGGATGHNIYTGAGTSSWDEGLDRFHGTPYPSHAPIDESGRVTPKARIVSLLNGFFGQYGREFLETQTRKPLAWVLYLPYAYIGGWASGTATGGDHRDGYTAQGFRIPKCGSALSDVQRTLLSLRVDYGLVNLEAASSDVLATYPFLILRGGFFMDRKSQDKLCGYLDAGGKLIVIEELPALDGEFEEYTRLKDRAHEIAVVPEETFLAHDFGDYLLQLGVERPLQAEGCEQAWLYDHPARDIQYLFLLAKDRDGSSRLRWQSRSGRLTLETHVVSGSGAVIRVEDGRLSAALLMGTNDRTEDSVAPFCRLADSEISADAPCDLLVFREGDGFQVEAANVRGEEVALMLPDGRLAKIRAGRAAL